MLNSGSLLDQPDWYIDLLGWFLPRYDSLKWHSKAKMILGSDKKQTALEKSKALKHGNYKR
jgi:hypothetical protein